MTIRILSVHYRQQSLVDRPPLPSPAGGSRQCDCAAVRTLIRTQLQCFNRKTFTTHTQLLPSRRTTKHRHQTSFFLLPNLRFALPFREHSANSERAAQRVHLPPDFENHLLKLFQITLRNAQRSTAEATGGNEQRARNATRTFRIPNPAIRARHKTGSQPELTKARVPAVCSVQ